MLSLDQVHVGGASDVLCVFHSRQSRRPRRSPLSAKCGHRGSGNKRHRNGALQLAAIGKGIMSANLKYSSDSDQGVPKLVEAERENLSEAPDFVTSKPLVEANRAPYVRHCRREQGLARLRGFPSL